MSERCPLVGDLAYWDGNIPKICRVNCESVWDTAENSSAPKIEFNSEDRVSDVENGGEGLQKQDEGAGRTYLVLNVLMSNGGDAFTELYDFTCPND